MISNEQETKLKELLKQVLRDCLSAKIDIRLDPKLKLVDETYEYVHKMICSCAMKAEIYKYDTFKNEYYKRLHVLYKTINIFEFLCWVRYASTYSIDVDGFINMTNYYYHYSGSINLTNQIPVHNAYINIEENKIQLIPYIRQLNNIICIKFIDVFDNKTNVDTFSKRDKINAVNYINGNDSEHSTERVRAYYEFINNITKRYGKDIINNHDNMHNYKLYDTIIMREIKDNNARYMEKEDNILVCLNMKESYGIFLVVNNVYSMEYFENIFNWFDKYKFTTSDIITFFNNVKDRVNAIYGYVKEHDDFDTITIKYDKCDSEYIKDILYIEADNSFLSVVKYLLESTNNKDRLYNLLDDIINEDIIKTLYITYHGLRHEWKMDKIRDVLSKHITDEYIKANIPNLKYYNIKDKVDDLYYIFRTIVAFIKEKDIKDIFIDYMKKDFVKDNKHGIVSINTDILKPHMWVKIGSYPDKNIILTKAKMVIEDGINNVLNFRKYSDIKVTDNEQWYSDVNNYNMFLDDYLNKRVSSLKI